MKDNAKVAEEGLELPLKTPGSSEVSEKALHYALHGAQNPKSEKQGKRPPGG